MPENDPDLPPESRVLARAERIRLAEDSVRASVASNIVVSVLEKLYVDAVREDRVVDAQFYLRGIKSYYPTWRYTPKAEPGGELKKEEAKQ